MRKSRGFTLIELVVVITIIGILAAIAMPRFINLQREARIAKLNSARGAVASAAALVHSVVLSKNGVADTIACPGGGGTANNTTTMCTESGIVAIFNGYPATPAIGVSPPGIIGASGLTTTLNPTLPQLQAEGYNVTSATTNDTIIQIQGAPDSATCQFTYTQAVAGAAPGIGSVITSGC